MCYGGHQFGHWAGQLGDGRATNLFQLDTKKAIDFSVRGSRRNTVFKKCRWFSCIKIIY